MEQTYGKPRRKEHFWQRHIDGCQASSQSQKDYCNAHGLALATFSYWKRKLQKQETTEGRRFYPLTIAGTEVDPHNSTGNDGNLTLCIDRFRLEIGGGCDADHLRRVIHVLESLSQ